MLQQPSANVTTKSFTETTFQDQLSDVECPDSWCAQPYIAMKMCQNLPRSE